MSDYKPPMCCGEEMEQESTGAEYCTERWLWCSECSSTADLTDEYWEWYYEGFDEWYRQSQIEEKRIKSLKLRLNIRVKIINSILETGNAKLDRDYAKFTGKLFVEGIVKRLTLILDKPTPPKEYWAIAGRAYEAAKAVV